MAAVCAVGTLVIADLIELALATSTPVRTLIAAAAQMVVLQR